VWEDGGRASELKKMEEKEKGKKYFRTHEDLAIYQLAFETAMNVLRRCGKCGRIREGGKKLIQSQSAPLSSHTSPSSHPPHTSHTSLTPLPHHRQKDPVKSASRALSHPLEKVRNSSLALNQGLYGASFP
jgi:hypothetical protein